MFEKRESMTGNERSRADDRLGDAILDEEGSGREHGGGQSMTGSVFRQHVPGLEQDGAETHLACSRRFDRDFLSSKADGPLSYCACGPQSHQCLPWDKGG